MFRIKVFTEAIFANLGLTGDMIPLARHIVLVVIAILLAGLTGLAFRKLIIPLLLKLTKKTDVKWDDIIFNEQVLISASNILPAIVIWQLLPMVFFEFPTAHEVLTRLTAIYITFMSVKTAIVFIDSFKQFEGDKRTSTQQYLYTFCGVLKLIMVFIAIIIVVAITLNKNPSTLFAGLGATSAILMLVFKDTIEGLVAGVRLTSENMLHKGDWITVPGAGANGTVEEMSLTTVKVRNFDNTITTVSPTTLVNGSFQNWVGMQQSGGRKAVKKVFFDFRSISIADDKLLQHLTERGYYSPESLEVLQKQEPTLVNLTLFRQYLEQWLHGRPEVNSEMTILVHQLEATQAGLPIEIVFFLHAKDGLNYNHQADFIMEYVYAVSPDFGLRIYQQFPEQDA